MDDKPEVSSDDIRIALLTAINAVEDLTRDLISAELRELEPVFDVNISQRADAAKEALDAVTPLQTELAALDAEIAQVEGKCSGWEHKFTDTRAETRVEYRRLWQDWDAELRRLRDKRDLIEQELAPLQAHAVRMRREAEDAVMGKYNLAAAIQNPFEHSLGQATRAYAQFRLPETWRVIVGADKHHPEWDQALTQLRELCLISGYRAEDLTDVDADRARKFWDTWRDEHWGEAEPRPTGLEDITGMQVIAENKRISQIANVVEDRRGYRSPGSYPNAPDIPEEYRRR